MRLSTRTATPFHLFVGGYPTPNSHGVYADATAEVLEWRNPARRKEFCQIRLMQIADGWVMATRGNPPSGKGWADPLTARWLYFSRDDALAGAAIRLGERLDLLGAWNFGPGPMNSWLAAAKEWLAAYEAKTTQPFEVRFL